jgi:hypothetical protein
MCTYVLPFVSCSLFSPLLFYTHDRVLNRAALLSNMFDIIIQGVKSAMESLTSSHLALAIITSALVYILRISIYRLYFHPLKNHPGPFQTYITPTAETSTSISCTYTPSTDPSYALRPTLSPSTIRPHSRPSTDTVLMYRNLNLFTMLSALIQRLSVRY